MKVAVLAVQGAFAEHMDKLKKLGVDGIELRQASDLEQDFDGLILPGGESTVQGKLLRELYMLEPLKNRMEQGLPVLATCAGMILLAQEISNDNHVYFGTLPVRVQRNAYGRQLGSFHTEQEFAGIGRVPMTFIRAPYVEEVFMAKKDAQILACVDDRIVAVRSGNQIGVAFHPELDDDDRIHEMFLKMCTVPIRK
ncbi:MAG: pyridoxal 5'-phosphate synthase glutaminase subunit PdxT [Eubacterium sp.]|nr:pyridoxal 5'-phosphate synthase glutaminase subunit PdxT [Eubacterium sp.]